jgi:phosphoglycerate dehydrogenase-like enzyme
VSLKENRYFAALDVHEKEPLSPDSEFLQLENVICTPHIGAFSKYYKNRMALTVVEDLERWTKGEELQGSVNLEQYLRMTNG